MSDKKVKMTEKMALFIEKNKVYPVVSGERLGADARPALTREQFEEPGFVRYVLEDKSTHVLSEEDTSSAPDFTPRWFGIDK